MAKRVNFIYDDTQATHSSQISYKNSIEDCIYHFSNNKKKHFFFELH